MGLCITGDCKANTGTAKQEQLVKSVLERLQGSWMTTLLACMLIANGRSLGLSECTVEMPVRTMPCVAGVTAAPAQGLSRHSPMCIAKGLCIDHLHTMQCTVMPGWASITIGTRRPLTCCCMHHSSTRTENKQTTHQLLYAS